MIQSGDRILVGVSGGKDSLSLLNALRELQARAPITFTLAAATVDPQTPEYDPKPLIPYIKAMGMQYHYLSQPLIEMAKEKQPSSLCAFCSRMRRGILYSCMRKYDYNVLALGQHLDDLCESFVMSAFFNGNLHTMKANYRVTAGDLRVIRPLIYVRERTLSEFATENNLPVISDNCPACFSAPKQRLRAKMMLSQQEADNPTLFSSLLQTMRPLIAATGGDDSGDEKPTPDESQAPPSSASAGSESDAPRKEAR
eukprot:Polyplicarium_translucidae@DN2774_c0_g1_i1.p1